MDIDEGHEGSPKKDEDGAKKPQLSSFSNGPLENKEMWDSVSAISKQGCESSDLNHKSFKNVNILEFGDHILETPWQMDSSKYKQSNIPGIGLEICEISKNFRGTIFVWMVKPMAVCKY